MAEKSSFFNSVNGDRKYKAEDYANYFNKFLTDGVFPNVANNLQIIADAANMTVKVKTGSAWIKGYMYHNDSDLVLQHDVADGVLKRIDRIVVKLDYLQREIRTVIKKGSFASTPVAPTVQRDADAYELVLADVFIGNGVTSISQSNVTDQRLNTSICGMVNSLLQADTTAIFNQYQQWFNETSVQHEQEFDEWFSTIQGQLSGDIAGNLQNQITQLDTDVTDMGSDLTNLENSFSAHSTDNVKHITAAERTKWDNSLPKTGGELTGKLTISEMELKDSEVIKTKLVQFNNVPHEKMDIEIPPNYTGAIEVSLTSTFAGSNASGSLIKLFNVCMIDNGSAYTNNSMYLMASSDTANGFAISDPIWNASKLKWTIKIVNRSGTSNPAYLVVKFKGGDPSSLVNARNSTFSSIYTTDTTVYGKPIDLKQSVSDGKNVTVRNAISGKGGTVTDTTGTGIPSFQDLANGINGIITGKPRAFGSNVSTTGLVLSVRGLAFRPATVVVMNSGITGGSIASTNVGSYFKASGSSMATANGFVQYADGFDIQVISNTQIYWEAYGE